MDYNLISLYNTLEITANMKILNKLDFSLEVYTMYGLSVTLLNISFLSGTCNSCTYPLLPTLVEGLGKRSVFVAETTTILLMASSSTELLTMWKI